MGVAPSSATSMLKKLAALGLAEHAPYRGVELSEAGTKIALEVIRHHRLLEQYLAETLGLGIDAVHAEADRLEHVISEELEARIDEQLGYPTHDPHGDPIPDAGLNVDRPADPRRRRGTTALPCRTDDTPGPEGDDAPIRAFRRPPHRGCGRERARHLPRAGRPDRSFRLSVGRVAEKPAFEGLEQLFLGERLDVLVDALLGRDVEIVADGVVGGLQRVTHLVALEDEIVGTRSRHCAVPWIDGPAHGPDGPRPSLDPDDDLVAGPVLAHGVNDPFGEANLR